MNCRATLAILLHFSQHRKTCVERESASNALVAFLESMTISPQTAQAFFESALQGRGDCTDDVDSGMCSHLRLVIMRQRAEHESPAKYIATIASKLYAKRGTKCPAVMYTLRQFADSVSGLFEDRVRGDTFLARPSDARLLQQHGTKRMRLDEDYRRYMSTSCISEKLAKSWASHG